MDGYIYILTNESMPGLVKIGRSIHGGSNRARQIYTTGVPTPFDLAFEIFSGDTDLMEKHIHHALSKYRVNEGREFFSCPLHVAIHAVLNIFCAPLDWIVCMKDTCMKKYESAGE